MEKDIRPLYVWIVVVLANIGVFWTIVLMHMIDGGQSFLEAILVPIVTNFLGVLVASLLITVTPVLINRHSTKWCKICAYGSFVVSIVCAVYLLWDSYTCSGVLCGLLNNTLAGALVLLAGIFVLFHHLDIFFRKSAKKYVTALIIFELVVLLIALMITLYYVLFFYRVCC